MAGLNDALTRALNHLIDGAGWASARLRPFAGQQFRIDGTPLPVHLAVAADGRLTVPDSEDEPAVTITLPDDFALLFVVDRQNAFGSAKLAGTADFAEALGFVFRNLRWDLEADLSRFVGDIAAHRLVQGGEAFVAWQKQAAGNLAANVGEYVLEERRMILTRPELKVFAEATADVGKDLDSLESRLRKLEAAGRSGG